MDMYEAYLTRAYGKLNMHLLSLSANSLQAEASPRGLTNNNKYGGVSRQTMCT